MKRILAWWRQELSEAEQLLAGLPLLADLLALGAGAGLNLHGCLQLAAEGLPEGPLRATLYSHLQQVALGRSLEQVLGGWAKGGPFELQTFIGLLLRAQRLGTPLEELLLSQAEELRLARRRRLEAELSRLPLKLTLITVLFFLPSIFLLVVLPGVLTFMGSW